MNLTDKKVAYLGGVFTFHHMAAMAHFPNAVLQAESNFDSIIEHVLDESVELGIIAIDNTLAGFVNGNIERICEKKVNIQEELQLKINLHLACGAPLRIEQIKMIYSHPMAIKETSNFFMDYPNIQFIETQSTSAAMELVAEKRDKFLGCIGNLPSIEYHNLHLVKSYIDNAENNITRFFVIGNKNINTTFFPKKASYYIHCKSIDVLNVILNLSNCKIVLCKKVGLIEQMDCLKYYVEVDFSQEKEFNAFHEKLHKICLFVKLIGRYQKSISLLN